MNASASSPPPASSASALRCPACQAELIKLTARVYECAHCKTGYSKNSLPKRTQRTERRVKGEVREKYQDSASERQIQATIVQGLRLKGFTVMETGQRRSDLAGNTVGLPDVFVTHPEWQQKYGLAFWIALEVKAAKGKIRSAQKVLISAGVSNVVRSWEEVEEVIGQLEGDRE